MMTTTEREAAFADVAAFLNGHADTWEQDGSDPCRVRVCRELANAYRTYAEGVGVPSMETLRQRRNEAIARAEKAEKDAAIYKDAFKDATMANTVSARKLAEQEAKTVEYRAAWIKAQRERDVYARRLRDARGLADTWKGLVGDESSPAQRTLSEAADDLRETLEVKI